MAAQLPGSPLVVPNRNHSGRVPAHLLRGLRYRSTARQYALGLLAAACVIASGAVSADVKIELSPGFDGNYRPGSWTPLLVKVSHVSTTQKGQLQIQVRSRLNGSTVYTQSVNLHAGSAADLYTVYYLHPDSSDSPEISAQLIVDGRSIAEKKLDAAIPIMDGQPAVVGLTQDQSGLNFLNQVDLGIIHRDGANVNNPYAANGFPGANQAPNPGGIQRRPNPTRVLYPPAIALPSSSFGYRSLDAVVLGDLPLDSLSEDQWTALVGWVNDGGVLVVSGGADINRARSKLLAPILPIKVTGVRQASALPSLGSVYGAAPKLTSAAVLTGSLVSDAHALCSDANNPTISARSVGNGTVILTSFDLLSSEFRAWPGQTRFWQTIMARSQRTLRLTDSLRSSGRQNRFPMWMNQDNGANRALTDALAGIQSVEAPPFQYIGLFLLAYIIFLVPVNYLLLKRLDRKELAWITAPAIILVFSVGAYAQGYRIKGGQLYLRSCAVIEGAANADTYEAYTVASIFSPRQDRYNLSVADPYALPSEITESNGYQPVVEDSLFERGERTSTKNALVNMWDHRNFGFESHVKLSGSVSASLEQLSPRAGKINLSNGTQFTLTDCSVAFRGNQAPIGTLKPGDAKSVTIALDGNNAGITVVATPPPPAGNQPNATEFAIKQALANIAASVQGIDASTGQNNSPLVLTGWFNDDVTGLTIDSDQAKRTNVNLLVVHLPTPDGLSSSSQITVGRPIPGSGGGFPMGGPGFPPNRTPRGRMVPSPAFQQAQSANYFNNMAYTYAGQGRLDLALNAAQQALRLAPSDGNILDTVGEMHQRRKSYKQAAQYYALALSRQPGGGMTETHGKYGETLLAMGDRANAIRQLQIAARDAQSPYGVKSRQTLQRLGVSTAPPGSQTF